MDVVTVPVRRVEVPVPVIVPDVARVSVPVPVLLGRSLRVFVLSLFVLLASVAVAVGVFSAVEEALKERLKLVFVVSCRSTSRGSICRLTASTGSRNDHGQAEEAVAKAAAVAHRLNERMMAGVVCVGVCVDPRFPLLMANAGLQSSWCGKAGCVGARPFTLWWFYVSRVSWLDSALKSGVQSLEKHQSSKRAYVAKRSSAGDDGGQSREPHSVCSVEVVKTRFNTKVQGRGAKNSSVQ